MTYLQMVNNVLTRMRERTVSSVAQNTYSSLIGVLVNDAKREVEDAWDWSALRTTLSADTVASTFSYSLVGSQNKINVMQVLNDTDDVVMKYMDAKLMTEKLMMTPTATEGSPEFYSFNGIDANGDTIVDVYPIPDDVYTLRFNCTLRNPDLSLDTDELEIPTQPVLLLAWAKAIEERGEDAGVMTSSAYMTAQRSIADAVSLDAQTKHPEELIWNAI